MLVFVLVFALGWGTKIAVDETDKYTAISDIQECIKLTEGKLWLLDPCANAKRGNLGKVVELLNTQPNFWESLYEDAK